MYNTLKRYINAVEMTFKSYRSDATCIHMWYQICERNRCNPLSVGTHREPATNINCMYLDSCPASLFTLKQRLYSDVLTAPLLSNVNRFCSEMK